MNKDVKKLLEDHPDLTQMHGDIDIVDEYEDHDVLLFSDGFVYILKHDPR